jgi:hypothetical protein
MSGVTTPPLRISEGAQEISFTRGTSGGTVGKASIPKNGVRRFSSLR